MNNEHKDYDAAFKKLSASSQKNLRNGEYGLYRNDLYTMSEILRLEEKHQDQLKLLCLIFHIDLAGYSSLEELNYMLSGTKLFQPITPMIAPRIVKNICSTTKRLKMDADEIGSFYRAIVSDSMLPAHLYTARETEKFLLHCLLDGIDKVNQIIQKRKKFKIINI